MFLMDFARGYDKALERRMDAEQYADFRNFNGTPVLKTEYSIENQMSEELEGSLHYFAESDRSEGAEQSWQVYRFEERSGINSHKNFNNRPANLSEKSAISCMTG
ncbi:hypothetical protein ACLOJK_026080 [Asimina triloba]